eukprot:m.25698 g.25698  ORF g.25698 m.25698 type:complete len:1114 (+) comp28916_c0_seq2:103-3444(+)
MRAKERGRSKFSPRFQEDRHLEEKTVEVEKMDVDEEMPQVPGEEALLPDEGKKDLDEEGEDDRLKATGAVEMTIEDVENLKGTVYSDIIWIRGLPWRLMAMPKGNFDENAKTLGIFLQCCPNEVVEAIPSSWYCHAIVEFRVNRHLSTKKAFTRRIEHSFCTKENDWGFPSFLTWEDLLNLSEGYLCNGALDVSARVTADAPHGVNWDSKRLTGHVGLKNQGATCYMSSLLQTLFFTTKLQKAVYHIPTEMDDSDRSVAFAMQRVFYELQFSDKPVATKKLTKSFGWDTWDSFMQHDIQELCRVLLDNLEQKMVGTVVEGTIPKLFEGKMESYVKCTQVDYTSSRTEPFMDIQLNIKGKKNIFESFDDYIASELLNGDNKYDAGDLGLQEAKKGVIFTKLPPVLNLHLMRFQYDPKTETNIKVNDKYEFPHILDLDKYMKEPQGEPSLFKLFAVLVHSGDYHGGHYVAYLNPGGHDEWFKFDDDVVSCCTASEAVDSNYGGTNQDYFFSRMYTNAYMLVYAKESCLETVLAPVLETDIPNALIERLVDERSLEERRRKEKRESHLYLDVQVFTADHFHSHIGYDLFGSRENVPSAFRVVRMMPFNEVQNQISNQMGYGLNKLRLWVVQARQNSTYRPAAIGPQQLHDPISTFVISSSSSQCVFFAETLAPDVGADQLPEYDIASDLLLFFKWYNPASGILSFVTYFPVPLGTKFSELVPALCSSVGLPEDTKLDLYEEICQRNIEPVNLDSLVSVENEYQDGDIICFQKACDFSLSFGFPASVDDYFKQLDTEITVMFHDATTPGDIGSFSLDLSYRLNYNQVASHVGTFLDVDPLYIQFLQPNPSRTNVPGHPLRSTFTGTLKDLVSMSMRLHLPHVLFYQKIPMRIDEYETKRELRCLFFSKSLKEAKELLLFVNVDSTIRDVLLAAKKQLSKVHGYEVKNTLRLVDVVSARIFGVYSEDGRTDAIPQSKVVRLEEVPEEEMALAEDEMLVPVAHFHKEVFHTFGTPFFLVLKDKEPISSLRYRIQEKLELSDKDFEKYKLAVVKSARPFYFSEDESDKEAISLTDFKPTPSIHPRYSNIMGNLPWLGLDHVNRNPKRTRIFLEKAIKIFN